MWNDLPAKHGIYMLTNCANNKVYVGSSVNIRTRCMTHSRELNGGIHYNSHLQAAWLLYGADAFTANVLELTPELDVKQMIVREQWWIDHYGSESEHHGYNKAPAGRTRGRTGLGWSPAERQRISQGQRRFFDNGGVKNVSHGSAHVYAKLTEDDVRAIRVIYGPPRGRRYSRKGGVRLSDLADKYGVTVSVISEAVNYITWKHVE